MAESPSAIDLIRQRVQERLEHGLAPALLERVGNLHAKRKWRDCDCSYCVVKRQATDFLGKRTRACKGGRAPELVECKKVMREQLEYEKTRA